MKLKRIIAVFALLCMVACMLPPTQTNAATYNGYTYTVYGGEATIIDYTGPGGNITIPSTLGGYRVTTIGVFAFYSDSLTSVVIPDSVTTINESAFESCDSLTSVVIPDSVTTIDNYAFLYCTSLTGIWVDDNNPNYSSDSYGVLFNKQKTELVQAPGQISGVYTISDGVTTIDYGAFSECTSLTSVEIPDSVTTIGNYAFQGCTSLTLVTYCGTEAQWHQIRIDPCNGELTSTTRQYHDYQDGICTACGHAENHAHTWEDGACANCGFALVDAIDLDGDGRVTAFDAQMLAEAQAGLRQLTDEQWQALGDLTPADIKAYILGRF